MIPDLLKKIMIIVYNISENIGNISAVSTLFQRLFFL